MADNIIEIDINDEDYGNVELLLAKKTQKLKEQQDLIISLKRELEGVISERDMLLCEVSNLRFELEMVELKRLQDDNFPPKIDRSQPSSSMQSYTPEQTYFQAQNYMNTSQNQQSYSSTCNGNSSNTLPSYPQMVANSFMNHQQSLHKKTTLRNGDIMKRNRAQNMYELSQDLLDKQIEMLERKYGGVKARTAALIIQRAFRHYTLSKKFAAIASMAKTEKSSLRRIMNSVETENTPTSPKTTDTEQYESPDFTKQFESEQICSSSHPIHRPMPVRSLSLRERRNAGNNASLPRSQSGTPNVCWDNFTPRRLAINTHAQNSMQFYNHMDANNLKQVNSYSTLWKRTDSNQIMCNSNVKCVNGYSRPCQNNACNQITRKVPPEVPKRTSSISSKSVEQRQQRVNGLTKTNENGSVSSVQSSGSDSSISADRVICDGNENCRFSISPVWKRKVHIPEYSETISETSLGSISHTSGSAYTLEHSDQQITTTNSYKISETVRKRQYRVGLNLFNKKPERGIAYLIRRGFLENSPQGVARFLISRKGLSKQMIGEYLGNLQSPFSMTVLECFAQELDLSGMQVDVALRKYQAYFRMPGEAQKIERLMEIFAQRYCQCNLDVVTRLRSPDTVFVLAFAIIMLNTDLHTPNLKPERRMTINDFIKNLRGIDDCGDIDSDMLAGIYNRVKANEFKPGSDHVTQVMKVQSTIVGKKPNLALPHRRLVCYCRLYEIPDVNKKERPGVHQREVFLFNDLLVITKILSKKKSSVTYTFRKSFPLVGIDVTLFESPYYLYGIKLSQRVDKKLLIIFNARNEHDRFKFAEDLRESICEMDEMENLRIEAELERQKSNRGNRAGTENRDSGVADVEVCPCVQNISHRTGEHGDQETEETQFKRSAFSNSLLDIHEQFSGEKMQRRGSVGSLDSGMSVSFHSTLNSNDKFNIGVKLKQAAFQQSFLSGIFKREQNLNRSEEANPLIKSTDV